jgi:hypothetical protein
VEVYPPSANTWPRLTSLPAGGGGHLTDTVAGGVGFFVTDGFTGTGLQSSGCRGDVVRYPPGPLSQAHKELPTLGTSTVGATRSKTNHIGNSIGSRRGETSMLKRPCTISFVSRARARTSSWDTASIPPSPAQVPDRADRQTVPAGVLAATLLDVDLALATMLSVRLCGESVSPPAFSVLIAICAGGADNIIVRRARGSRGVTSRDSTGPSAHRSSLAKALSSGLVSLRGGTLGAGVDRSRRPRGGRRHARICADQPIRRTT